MKSLVTVAALLVGLLVPASTSWAAQKESPWGATYFPNVPLVTQDGKTVMFYEDLLKDKKVLINFIFARCEQVCPLDTAKMVQVQKLLGPRLGRDLFMYSITLDPENDTPEVLKAYAAQYGAGPGWLFLTGTRENIDKVRFKLGDRREKEAHANTVQVGDVAKSRWMRIPLGADPNYIFVEITKTLDPGSSAGKPLKSIAEAPRVTQPVPGQRLFANRCASCHTLGRGDGLGPDLKGVTARRERAWLLRFLAAPDRMRASQDPIAVELAKRYAVPMPNLNLTRQELADVLQYLEASTPAQPSPTPAQGAAPDAPSAPAHEHHHHEAGGGK